MSLEVTRRVQIVRQYLMSIPRRRLSVRRCPRQDDHSSENSPPAAFRHPHSTPAVQAGFILQASAAQKTDLNQSAGHKEEEEESNAGGPAEGNDTNAQARAATKALADAMAAAAKTEAHSQRSKRKGTNAGNAGAKADETRGATRVRRRKGSAGSCS